MSKSYFCVSFLILFCLNLFGQVPYYDAIKLKKYAQFNLDSTKIQLSVERTEVEAILKYYFISKRDTNNPFINVFSFADEQFSISDKEKSILPSLISSIGSFNATNIAAGLSDFLIERANEEINVMFFNKFKKVLEDSEEFQIVFPKTYAIIRLSEPYQYAANLNILKEAFKEDFSNLITNLEELASLEKYQKLAAYDPAFKFIYVSLASVAIVEQIRNGTHPANVLEKLHEKNYLSVINNNVMPALQTAAILSQSVRDTSANRTYVKFKDINQNILSDSVTLKIYLGLLYQKVKFFGEDEKGITFYNNNTVLNKVHSVRLTSRFENNKTFINEFSQNYRNLVSDFDKIDEAFSQLKTLKIENEATYLEYYNLTAAIVASFQDVSSLLKDFKLNGKAMEHVDQYVYVAKLANDVFKNVNEKNYSLAVLNFSGVIDTLFDKYDVTKYSDDEVALMICQDKLDTLLLQLSKSERDSLIEIFSLLVPKKSEDHFNSILKYKMDQSPSKEEIKEAREN